MGNVTKEIAKYILEQKISVDMIEKELHIPKRKLDAGTEENLTAEEFLMLCVYLKICPESFYCSVEGLENCYKLKNL